MDGTLLNEKHQLAQKTIDAILRAQAAGIVFVVVTGRSYMQAVEEFKGTQIYCDYIVGSGAEVRTWDGKLKSSIPLCREDCEMVYRTFTKSALFPQFASKHYEYVIGDKEKAETNLMCQMKDFFFSENMPDEEIRKNELYQKISQNRKILPNFLSLYQLGEPIYKVSVHSSNQNLLKEVQERLKINSNIAVTASFHTNIEITDARAQKGLVLAEYIQNLGYKMEEVMVLGDSMNDYSMLSMDFGATVAMQNSMAEVKRVAKYITKSNDEYGVAYAIEKVLEKFY